MIFLRCGSHKPASIRMAIQSLYEKHYRFNKLVAPVLWPNFRNALVQLGDLRLLKKVQRPQQLLEQDPEVPGKFAQLWQAQTLPEPLAGAAKAPPPPLKGADVVAGSRPNSSGSTAVVGAVASSERSAQLERGAAASAVSTMPSAVSTAVEAGSSPVASGALKAAPPDGSSGTIRDWNQSSDERRQGMRGA